MTSDLAACLDDLVLANRILADQGVLDAFGHVSIRDPGAPDRFWLSRNLAPALVERDDLMCFDLDGTARGDDRRPYLERFIHGALYRQRSDIGAVVHSHARSVIPFGVSKLRLRPVCHMCGFLGPGAPVFEIRDHLGDASDLLIRDGSSGAALAAEFQSDNVVLMRGHGMTVAGSSVREAVFRSVYTMVNATLQAEAHRLSDDVTYLTEAEAAAADRTNSGQIGRAWQVWKQAVSRPLPTAGDPL